MSLLKGFPSASVTYALRRASASSNTSSNASSNTSGFNVIHLKADQMFKIDIPEHQSPFLKYRHINSKSVDLFTTQVPVSLEGRGIAKLLTEAALTYARENGLKVKPSCWYVDGYLKRHSQHGLEVID